MNYFLIDYENVKVHGLDGLSKLDAEDVVCIFYSENADTLTFGLHKRLNEAKATVLYQKVEVGQKNSLDFQLSSYLGYIIHENHDKSVSYYIVTKDKGFACLANYWKRRKVDIDIAADLCGKGGESLQDDLQDDLQPGLQDDLKMQVEQLLEEKDIADEVAGLIRQCETKLGLNNALMKAFPSEGNIKASKIYKAIKPLIADKRGR